MLKKASLLLFFLLQLPLVWGQSTLTVTGNGQVRVDPDLAVVRVGVMRQSATAQAAQEEANRVSQSVLDGVVGLGISDKDIQTVNLSLSPVYAHHRSGNHDEPQIVGYQASNVISVRIEDLSRIGPVVDATIKAGANRLEGVHFQLREDGEAKAQALKAAVLAARAKAQAMAEALAVELVEILEVSEGGSGIRPVQRLAAGSLAEAADVAISPGQLSVPAEVSITYSIR